MTKTLDFAVALFATALALRAQACIAPSTHATTTGHTSSPLPGIGYRGRAQVLVGAVHLQAIVGKSIDELWLRRDSGTPETLVGGTSTLRVRISETPTAPERAARTFALNHGPSPVDVFQGTLVVPASPPPGSDPWAADQTVRVAFASPFLYGSGNLCIEIECTGAEGASPFWPVEGIREALAGSVGVLGSHCSRSTELVGTRMASANAETLTIGATAEISTGGRYGSFAALLFGTEIPGGIDLSGIGMSGCTLFVQPSATFATTLSARPNVVPAWETAFASFRFAVPFDATLLSGTFVTQVANLEIGATFSNPLGVTLSEGLRLSLAASAPTLAMATVESPQVDAPAALPGEGNVVNQRAPVLKLLYH